MRAGRDAVKILVFLEDPSTAHDVVRSLGRLVASHEGGLEVHLSRVLNFGGSRSRPPSAKQAVGIGVGSAAANSVQDTADGDGDAAQEYLARLSHYYFAGVATKRVVFGNTPAAEIIAYAQREDIGLIAIADQGNRGIGKMLLFSGTVPLLKVPCMRVGKQIGSAGSSPALFRGTQRRPNRRKQSTGQPKTERRTL